VTVSRGERDDPMMWGKRKENGVWIARKPKRRFMWRNHDSLYVALWRLRLRLIKPWRPHGQPWMESLHWTRWAARRARKQWITSVRGCDAYVYRVRPLHWKVSRVPCEERGT
jgi:hypothetical protein